MTHTEASPVSVSTARLTMTVPEVAVALGISRNHAYWLVANGQIPSKRLGRRHLISRQRLEEWLVTQEP